MIGATRLSATNVPALAGWHFGLVGAALTLALWTAAPESSWPALLAAMVAVVGMPHGALDFRVGRKLLTPAFGRRWQTVFLSGYLALMAAMIAGWRWLPLPTTALFVLLSAWHFGTSDTPPGHKRSTVLVLLQGGMAVWAPALFHPAEFTRLISAVVGDERWPQGLLFTPAFRGTLALALAALLVSLRNAPAATRGMVLGFTVLFALVAPLAGFAIYFCGWHSVMELARLGRQANPDHFAIGLRRVLVAAAPPTAFVASATLLGWQWLVGAPSLPPELLRMTFVSLSVVAVPHLLLHALAERRQLEPFTPHDEG
jgi:beta-carotene 15,15'-dioxygenase